MDTTQLKPLITQINQWAKDLGFDAIGISHTDLGEHEAHLLKWLQEGMHGDMQYMEEHGTKRSRPQELIPGTMSIISVRMPYLSVHASDIKATLEDHNSAYIARYALGRDYHKLMRRKLQKLATQIEKEIGPFGYRAFVDSAPILEKAVAERAGLGWIGKHSVLIDHDIGSWFFLGELFTDLPLPVSEPVQNRCGQCQRCIDVCPTNAIIAPYRLDARLCISYLTIELKGSIPPELRKLIGNRVFGCDDCQVFCPWNHFAKTTEEPDFNPRHRLDSTTLIELFAWSELEFEQRTEGSAIRRLGYERWLRNIAVGLGNSANKNNYKALVTALKAKADHASPLVREHVEWALQNIYSTQTNGSNTTTESTW